MTPNRDILNIFNRKLLLMNDDVCANRIHLFREFVIGSRIAGPPSDNGGTDAGSDAELRTLGAPDRL